MSKYNGWKNLPTSQSREILTELIEAKEDNRASMIIAGTGDGKTTAIRLFQAKKPKHTYVITIGDSYTLSNLLDEIMQILGVYTRYGRNARHLRMRAIMDKLNEITADGGQPVIIIDEAENAKISMLKAFKQLYDAVIGNCAIVLIGTDQLINAMNKKANGQSIPQLRRRFKAGTRVITAFNKVRDLKPFFTEHIPDQLDLQDLLIQLCDNYGELHDYLDPFLRYCDKKNIKPSEDAFRLYHKIPKRK
jgi:DNA transposition AAA+ family ATPase